MYICCVDMFIVHISWFQLIIEILILLYNGMLLAEIHRVRYSNTDDFPCVFLGRRSKGEDAEHGEVSPDGNGHGTSCGEEKPEQLEFTFPLVTVETTLRAGEKP